jgi:response regulator RpfG family c-di-GMP phosphodiesterase
VVESTDVLRNRIHKLLSDHGYHVTSYKDASGVREDLVASKSSPYSLIISSYMTPLMKGDEILKNAMQVVPDTQRSMMADAGKLQTLVSAINSAHIHSCLTIPFRDEDLLSQVKLRCVQYETDQKQKRIKKIFSTQL